MQADRVYFKITISLVSSCEQFSPKGDFRTGKLFFKKIQCNFLILVVEILPTIFVN